MPEVMGPRAGRLPHAQRDETSYLFCGGFMRNVISPDKPVTIVRRRVGTRILPGIAALCAAAATCWAVAQPLSPSPGPSPEQIVTARQAGLAMSAALLGTMKVALDRGATAETQAYQAGGLSRW